MSERKISKDMCIDIGELITTKFNPFSVDWIDKEPVNIISRGIQPGEGYEYISDSFINGLVNYRDYTVGGFMLRRYTDDEEWAESCKYIDSLVDEVHSNFRKCMDDVFLLMKFLDEEDNLNYIWYWYDQDVSDCCVAVFSADKVKDDVEALYALMKSAMTYGTGETGHPPYPKNELGLKNYIVQYGIENVIKAFGPECIHGWITL
jgi:hypothetical protein